MYGVAVLRKNDSLIVVNIRNWTEDFKEGIEAIKAQEDLGYTLDSCVITTSREKYLKTLLQARIEEYKYYLKSSSVTLERLKDNAGILRDTSCLINEQRNTMREVIAHVALRCITAGVTIDDPFVLDCMYDYELHI